MSVTQTHAAPAGCPVKCSTCGAESAEQAWSMCNAKGPDDCHGPTLFPVDYRIARVECGAIDSGDSPA